MTLEKIDAQRVKDAADLLALAERDTTLKKVASTAGGEWAGPCPACGGDDRFRVQPQAGRWLCRSCTAGKWQDAIAYGQKIHGLDFRAACEFVAGGQLPTITTDRPKPPPAPKRPPLESPAGEWVDRARALVDYSQKQLQQNGEALAYLQGRGLTDQTIEAARLGWNPKHITDQPAAWGLTGKPVHIPAGLVIPWYIEGELWRVEIRKPNGAKIGVRGYKQGLYNADQLRPDKPAVLVEGVIDALTIEQEAGELVTAVATGATTHARQARWIAKLALCPVVLVAFDNEPDRGQAAADYWLDVLPNARRWRPFWDDPNQMLQDGANLASWIKAGLGKVDQKPPPPDPVDPVPVDAAIPWGPGQPPFVDPDVSQLAREAPADCWPFYLPDIERRRWVSFETPAEVEAATLPSDGQPLLLTAPEALATDSPGGYW